MTGRIPETSQDEPTVAMPQIIKEHKSHRLLSRDNTGQINGRKTQNLKRRNDL